MSPAPFRQEVGPQVPAWQEPEPSGRSGRGPEVPWEAEGQRSWRFCLFLPSSLVPDLPRDQGARRSGTDRPRGSREQGEDRGTGCQRGLNNAGDAKVSKYWLLLTDR